ncbi:hypothetical protein RHOER0001_2381 [Rhodococcus erythropolis SK121]|nr:hypothetical protein RHOER0001_2381 [Rhodococcus erythropolis SK121]
MQWWQEASRYRDLPSVYSHLARTLFSRVTDRLSYLDQGTA